MPRKSRYEPLNEHKYLGNSKSIIARSSLERAVFRFLDTNANVVKWASEEVVVKYVCATDGKWHRYYVDVYVELNDGTKLLVEIKPKDQTHAPVPMSNMNPRQAAAYFGDLQTWLKNSSKWKFAEEYARKMNAKFVVWTEDHLKMMGIRGRR